MKGELSDLATVALLVVPIVLAVTLHESAHGYAALLLGDRTAYERGRISLNPLRHVDLFGTVIFPALALLLHAPIFGWAKPVPVNFSRLGHPKRDMVLVAAAGPATNILLAVVSTALMMIVPVLPDALQPWVATLLFGSVEINVFLAVFNMMPIPPLDGGRVVAGLLPMPLAAVYARLEPFGLLIVIGLFILLPALLGPAWDAFNPFRLLVVAPAEWLIERLTGVQVGS